MNVKVRTFEDGRTIQVHAGRAECEKLREIDRINVRYRTGRYTGTVWASEIQGKWSSSTVPANQLADTIHIQDRLVRRV